MGLFINIASGVVDIIAPLLTPLIQGLVKEVILVRLKEADEQAYKLVLITAYPAIDVYAENAAKKTESAIDDAVVNGFKLAFEVSAKEEGIELPNLDDD